MNPNNKLLARTLTIVVTTVLLLGSFVIPGVLYMQSSKWLVQPYDAQTARRFTVAFLAKDSKGNDAIRAVTLRPDIAKSYPYFNDIRYRLPEGEHREKNDFNNPHARITAVNEPGGSQLVKIDMTGDHLPWSSYSEYRVRDNRVEPLRYGHSNIWLILIGVPLCLILAPFLMKPIKLRIARMTGVEQKSTISQAA